MLLFLNFKLIHKQCLQMFKLLFGRSVFFFRLSDHCQENFQLFRFEDQSFLRILVDQSRLDVLRLFAQIGRQLQTLNVTPENWLKERLQVQLRFRESLSKFTTVSDKIYSNVFCLQTKVHKVQKDRERQRKKEKDRERQRKTEKDKKIIFN